VTLIQLSSSYAEYRIRNVLLQEIYTAIKKLLEKDVLHDNNLLQHPDMGINIAGLLLEQKKRIEEEKFLIINIIYTTTTLDFMQYRLITA
jgi:hypothetical protein